MITIRTYYDPVEANMAKALLESEGMLVFLKNENAFTFRSHFGNAVGGIELQVEAADADFAQEILGVEKEGNLEVVGRISQRWNRIFFQAFLVGCAGSAFHTILELDQGFDIVRAMNFFFLYGVIALVVSVIVHEFIRR